MKRRVLIVALAVVLAVLGTVGLFVYVNQADVRAIAGQQAVSVLIADKAVPSGTRAEDAQRTGLLRAVTLPAASVPPDAVVSITPELRGLVTSAAVAPGQLLLRPMLVTAAKSTGGLAIPEGMVAVSIKLCVPEAVAGHVRPGSAVAMFTTVVLGDQGGNAKPGCDGAHTQQGEAFTRVVLPRVEVLAVGTSTGEGADGSQVKKAASTTNSADATKDGVLLTVAVNQDDAERVITLTQAGLPYLALLGETSQIALDTKPAPPFPPRN